MGQKGGCWGREDAGDGAARQGQRVKGQRLRQVSRVPASPSFTLPTQEQPCRGRGHPPAHPISSWLRVNMWVGDSEQTVPSWSPKCEGGRALLESGWDGPAGKGTWASVTRPGPCSSTWSEAALCVFAPPPPRSSLTPHVSPQPDTGLHA